MEDYMTSPVAAPQGMLGDCDSWPAALSGKGGTLVLPIDSSPQCWLLATLT